MRSKANIFTYFSSRRHSLSSASLTLPFGVRRKLCIISRIAANSSQKFLGISQPECVNFLRAISRTSGEHFLFFDSKKCTETWIRILKTGLESCGTNFPYGLTLFMITYLKFDILFDIHSLWGKGKWRKRKLCFNVFLFSSLLFFLLYDFCSLQAEVN